MPLRVVPEDGFTIHVARVFERDPDGAIEREVELIIDELISRRERHAKGAYHNPEIIEIIQQHLAKLDLQINDGY